MWIYSYLYDTIFKTHHMKLTKIPLLLLTGLFVLAYSSCKKDTPVAVTYTVPGLWTGTYTVDQVPAQSPLFYAFAFCDQVLLCSWC